MSGATLISTHEFREREINIKYWFRINTDSWRTFATHARYSHPVGTIPVFKGPFYMVN